MHAFDILAEAKIRQWEQDKKEQKTSPQKRETLRIDPTESLEKQLYLEIRQSIIKAYLESGTNREDHLQMATKMEVQLSARLERSGYNMMSKLFSDEIRSLKVKARELSHDKQQLTKLLLTLKKGETS